MKQEDTMKKWEENVRRVVPYTPGEQPKKTRMIKLNTNENPYPPAPAVAEALRNFPADTLRMYPDPSISDLVGGIADFYRVKPEEVFVGVGSDDVLAMIFLTFFNSKKPVLFPDITYSFYDVWAELFRIPYETVPLDERFCIRAEDYRRENGGVIFPNPNAPTGELLPLETVERIIADNPDVIVVVDEAYIDFGGESALPLIHKYDNLIVVQTFSKSRSLAGSRIGYAFANEKLIQYLNDVKYSFNSYTIDRITIELGTKAIADRAYFEETTAKIIATREWTKKELAELGFVFGDSKSNFIFATHPKVDMVKLFEDLKQADIYVRHFNRPERIVPYLRISIGTDAQMQELVTFLKGYLKAEG
jgi:histidinol-phosphate aminotransferase